MQQRSDVRYVFSVAGFASAASRWRRYSSPASATVVPPRGARDSSTCATHASASACASSRDSSPGKVRDGRMRRRVTGLVPR